jgi:acyl-CoA reductase-like NAD-dependent aldehyde dehydrogenase
VILKPAEATPLTSLLMAEGMAEVGLPEGIYQVAPGKGSEIGPELVDLADMIMFTGSTEVGKSIMARAADTLTPVSLELGGKDPMIVLRDADVERAANAAAYYSMQNGGQTCISIERVYVEEPVYDAFVARVAEKVGALRQGVPTAVGTVDVGAMTIPAQIDTVSEHVEGAKQAGAKVLVGGHSRTGKGQYYEPTVLVDVDHSMAAMTEETFGPTLPIMKVADADEAVRLANDSPFGLSASVWSKDTGRAEEIARRVEAGAVCVNDAQINYLVLELPMGGWKTSGMGQRHGAPGIRKYTRQQSLLVTRLAPKKDLHMFPYKARTTNMLVKGVKLLYGRGKRD